MHPDVLRRQLDICENFFRKTRKQDSVIWSNGGSGGSDVARNDNAVCVGRRDLSFCFTGNIGGFTRDLGGSDVLLGTNKIFNMSDQLVVCFEKGMKVSLYMLCDFMTSRKY